MKPQHPRHNGHLTNRIHNLSKELKGHIAALSGMHEGSLSYDEMKHWTNNQFWDIHEALKEIELNYVTLINQEHSEMS